MFMHFAVFLIISKKKRKKFDQKTYDSLFHNIENNLRELGFGDVSVNQKMKDFNKILYDILIKIEKKTSDNTFDLNHSLISKYFSVLNAEKSHSYRSFNNYFLKFFNFCFVISPENMVKESINFKY